jgi:hypothetical protein
MGIRFRGEHCSPEHARSQSTGAGSAATWPHPQMTRAGSECTLNTRCRKDISPWNWFPRRGLFAGFLPLFFGDIGPSAGNPLEAAVAAGWWSSDGGFGAVAVGRRSGGVGWEMRIWAIWSGRRRVLGGVGWENWGIWGRCCLRDGRAWLYMALHITKISSSFSLQDVVLSWREGPNGKLFCQIVSGEGRWQRKFQVARLHRAEFPPKHSVCFF